MAKDIPYCPLMSAGSDIDKVCTLVYLRDLSNRVGI